MISRALRLMKDLSVAEIGNVQADPNSGALGNKSYRLVGACVQRNGGLVKFIRIGT